MNLKGKTLIITGASSGIGRALAVESSRRGAHLALADIDPEGLAETTERCSAVASADQTRTLHSLDVTDLAAWRSFLADAGDKHKPFDGIINNAGIALLGSVAETGYADIEKVMAVNFTGMVIGTKELLPRLLERPEAFIANISSVFGLFGMRGNSAYCASKFAIRGFTETLIQELRDSTVTVSCIHPGHIGTDIVVNAHAKGDVADDDRMGSDKAAFADEFKAKGLSPDQAATIILKGIERKKRRICVGRDARMIDLLGRFFPSWLSDRANEQVL